MLDSAYLVEVTWDSKSCARASLGKADENPVSVPYVSLSIWN